MAQHACTLTPAVLEGLGRPREGSLLGGHDLPFLRCPFECLWLSHRHSTGRDFSPL